MQFKEIYKHSDCESFSDDELAHEVALRHVYKAKGTITPICLVALSDFDINRIEKIQKEHDDLFEYGFEHFQSVFFEYKKY